MKKAKEYLGSYNNDKLGVIVRQIQIDTINHVTKRCAEEARAGYVAPKGDLDNIEIFVDKQSVLNVADKIKEELYENDKDS